MTKIGSSRIFFKCGAPVWFCTFVRNQNECNNYKKQRWKSKRKVVKYVNTGRYVHVSPGLYFVKVLKNILK